MKRKLFFAAMLGTLGWGAYAQAPAIQWQKCYGGTDSETAKSVKQTKDGGFIVVGTTSSTDGQVTGQHGGTDVWVIKISATGTLEWQKTIGGTMDDEGNDVVQTPDGGYAIAATSYSTDGDIASAGNHGGGDATLIRLSSTGTLLWLKVYGGSDREEGFGIINTADGGFVIDGGSASNDGQITTHHGATGIDDMWMMKTDASGTLLWNTCIGGTEDDGADTPTSVIQTKDGGYLFAGNTVCTDGDVAGITMPGANDMIVCKLDGAGKKVWLKVYGGKDDEDPPTSILQTKDGGYIIIGNSMSNDGDIINHHGTPGGSNDVWVLKITSTGTVQWKQSLGGSAEDNSEPGSISFAPDGGYIISCTSNSTGGDITGHHGTATTSDIWISHIDSVGKLLWQKSLGGTGDDVSGTSILTSDNGIVVVGGGATNDGDITGNAGMDDFWVVKLASAFGIENFENLNNQVVVYPNPSTGLFNLTTTVKASKIEVVNALGAVIYSAQVNVDRIQVNLSQEAKGVYFYTLSNHETIIGRGRLIVE